MTENEATPKSESAVPEHASVNDLVLGAAKTIDNAERLFHEAEILAQHGAVARALCLHQISLEECSKVDNLGAWAVSHFVGIDVPQEKVLAAFRRHSAKNKSNAYMLEPSSAEREARTRGDWDAAMKAFRQAQDEFHAVSNQAKNASLYVDWIDGQFVAPSERITGEMLAEIKDRNATFLGYASNGMRMLERLANTPDRTRDFLTGFIERLEKLRGEKPEDVMEAVSQFLEDGLQRLRD
jgi:AbiV family abortive infection protein